MNQNPRHRFKTFTLPLMTVFLTLAGNTWAGNVPIVCAPEQAAVDTAQTDVDVVLDELVSATTEVVTLETEIGFFEELLEAAVAEWLECVTNAILFEICPRETMEQWEEQITITETDLVTAEADLATVESDLSTATITLVAAKAAYDTCHSNNT